MNINKDDLYGKTYKKYDELFDNPASYSARQIISILLERGVSKNIEDMFGDWKNPTIIRPSDDPLFVPLKYVFDDIKRLHNMNVLSHPTNISLYWHFMVLLRGMTFKDKDK